MPNFLKFIAALHVRMLDSDSERGATATEYALLVAFIALVIIAGVTVFGGSLNTFFSNIGSQIGLINAS